MISYSVIIVNFNGEHIIGECLKSVYASSVKPEKVIVYDNASSDNSLSYIRDFFPDTMVIAGEKNIGFGRANNACLDFIDSEFILFLNNDAVVDVDCAHYLLESIGKDDNIFIVNPLIYLGWEKDSQNVYSFGAVLTKEGFGISPINPDIEYKKITCFSGACFMARTELFKKMRFQEKFFLYYEEPELSARALREGLLFTRCRKAIVHHLENASSPQDKNKGICFRQYYAIPNRFYMIGRYWPPLLTLYALPLNLFHLFYFWGFIIANKQWKYSGIILGSFKKYAEGFSDRKYNAPLKNPGWYKKLASLSFSELFSLKNKVLRKKGH